MISGVPGKNDSRQQIAVHHDHVQHRGWKTLLPIKDVSNGLDQSNEQSKEPEVHLLLRMSLSQQKQNGNQDCERRKIREKGVVHKASNFLNLEALRGALSKACH